MILKEQIITQSEIITGELAVVGGHFGEHGRFEGVRADGVIIFEEGVEYGTEEIAAGEVVGEDGVEGADFAA